MSTTRLSIYEWLEDFDNSELSESDWLEQMHDSVLDYNQEYRTDYNPTPTISNYQSWKRDKTDV